MTSIAEEIEPGSDGAREISAIRAVEAKGRGGRGATRCRIELEGEPWAEIDAEVVVRLGLKRGLRVTGADRERILHADQVLGARRWAAARCASRPRSRRALLQELRARKYPEAAIVEALDALEASGTLSDLEVGARHLRKRMREGGYGPERLRSELLALGLSRETAEAVLASGVGVDTFEACLELARKRAARYAPLEEARNLARLVQFLHRRGFESETIQRVTDLLGSEE